MTGLPPRPPYRGYFFATTADGLRVFCHTRNLEDYVPRSFSNWGGVTIVGDVANNGRGVELVTGRVVPNTTYAIDDRIGCVWQVNRYPWGDSDRQRVTDISDDMPANIVAYLAGNIARQAQRAAEYNARLERERAEAEQMAAQQAADNLAYEMAQRVYILLAPSMLMDEVICHNYICDKLGIASPHPPRPGQYEAVSLDWLISHCSCFAPRGEYDRVDWQSDNDPVPTIGVITTAPVDAVLDQFSGVLRPIVARSVAKITERVDAAIAANAMAAAIADQQRRAATVAIPDRLAIHGATLIGAVPVYLQPRSHGRTTFVCPVLGQTTIELGTLSDNGLTQCRSYIDQGDSYTSPDERLFTGPYRHEVEELIIHARRDGDELIVVSQQLISELRRVVTAMG